MAVMKLICGGCGAELSAHDTTCPQCGIAVEYPGGEQKDGSAGGRCPSCGHRNEVKGAFCEACGEKMKSETGKPTKKEHQRTGKKPAAGFARVHAPAIIMSLLFGGWAAYGELGRTIPSVEEHDHPVSDADHSSEETEIEQLQKRVEAHPEDDASLLQLANLLQDHSAHDQRYLIRAIEAYQRYLARNPQQENARVDLGICYFDLSRVDTIHGLSLIQRAMTEIGTVADANPEHQAAAFNLGIVTLNIGRTEESAGWFRRAVKINPGTDLGMRAQRLLEQHTFAEPTR